MVRRKQPKHFKQSPPLLTDFSPPELWDSYRALYTRLLLPTQVEEQRAVAVAGVRPGAAHAVICANLAVVASRSEPVLLVDACLQTPQQHALFQVSNVHGFSEALLGRCEWAACVQKNVRPGLDLLSAGAWTPDVAACFHTARVEALFEEARRSYGLVLVDTPPVGCSPDALLVGQSAAGVLLVVCKHRDRRTEVQESVAKLRGAQVSCLGSVLVRETRSRAPFCITNC